MGRSWQHIIPFLSLPEDLRRIVYPTNPLNAMHRQIRKAIKTRGHFPDEQAATRLIYLAIERAETTWRSAQAWTARRALKIHFEDRFPDYPTSSVTRDWQHIGQPPYRVLEVLVSRVG